jgi:hypothetical protein
MVRARHGRSMASVNQTRPHCVNQMGKTHSKSLVVWHGRGTAWARHVMCESAFRQRSHGSAATDNNHDTNCCTSVHGYRARDWRHPFLQFSNYYCFSSLRIIMLDMRSNCNSTPNKTSCTVAYCPQFICLSSPRLQLDAV